MNLSGSATTDICILISSFGSGGVERMLINLACGFSEKGYKTDFVICQENLPYLSKLPDNVQIINSKCDSGDEKLTFLTEYLSESQPRILLSAKSVDDVLALAARKASGIPAKVFLRVGTTLSGRHDFKNRFKRFFAVRKLRKQVLEADGIIAVCKGVAQDLVQLTGLPATSIDVVYNPVVDDTLYANSEIPVDHPWFQPEDPTPVIISVGRLAKAKGFADLLQAFACLRETLPARLVILGEGGQRTKLENLAQKLCIEEHVWMPGFIENPHPYIAKADVYVLSSYREGSPNALTEALALGVPCVATNCQSGPDEILKGGEYGHLVPVGDVQALADAMRFVLLDNRIPTVSNVALREYMLDVSVDNYLHIFGLKGAS